jgi:ArsR family transcriptional regulator
MDPFAFPEELLRIFKALADANRLRIIGLLSQSAHTGEQLAALLGLGASTVSHHLARLKHAGLISASAESYYSVYRLEPNSLEFVARQLASPDTLARLAAEADKQTYIRMQRSAVPRPILKKPRRYRSRRKS